MVRITDRTSIDRPVEEVWRFVSDPSNTPQWYQGTLEVRQRSEGPLAVGTTFEAAVRYRGRSLVFGARCIVLHQNHEVTWEFTSGPTQGSTDSWRMEPIDESVCVKFSRAASYQASEHNAKHGNVDPALLTFR